MNTERNWPPAADSLCSVDLRGSWKPCGEQVAHRPKERAMTSPQSRVWRCGKQWLLYEQSPPLQKKARRRPLG